MFDTEKLAWMNRHYLKAATPERLATLALPYLQAEGWVTEPSGPGLEFVTDVIPLAAASVDRLDQVPARLRFLFDYSAARALEDSTVRSEAQAARAVIAAFADVAAAGPPLADRETFRAAVAQVKERTGQKGKALLHPIRLALTGEPDGLELDLAVPAIERGAALGRPEGRPLRQDPVALGRPESRLYIRSRRGGPSGPPGRPGDSECGRASQGLSAGARVIIYGINPVLEALRAGRVKEIRLADRAGGRLAEVMQLARERGVPTRRVPADALEREARRGVHQGVVADIEDAETTASTSSCAAQRARRCSSSSTASKIPRTWAPSSGPPMRPASTA